MGSIGPAELLLVLVVLALGVAVVGGVVALIVRALR